MKRWSATLLVFAVCSAVVHADVTTVTKTTVEGGAAAAMASAGVTPPTITTRIKGGKSRTDLDMGSSGPVAASISTITDVAAKQVVIIDHNQKTARISGPGSKPAPSPDGSSGTMKVDGSVKPTGKSQTIDGLKCDEYAFTTSLSISEFGGGQMPAEAAEMMKDVVMVMKGSVWVAKDAPGIAEYRAYQKAMSSAELASVAMGASGLNMPGAEKLAKAMQDIDGIAVLTEVGMTISGGNGQMAEMMKQMMGDMKITTKVLSIKTDAIGDDAFKVPEGYQVIK
jgi:hypothetical protein